MCALSTSICRLHSKVGGTFVYGGNGMNLHFTVLCFSVFDKDNS